MVQHLALSDFPEYQTKDKGMVREGNSHHPTKFTLHRFNCFDGEGITIKGKHQYVYLAAYDSEQYYEIKNPNGLGTVECFRFLVNVAQTKSKMGINVIYGGTYDAEMMLRDLTIEALHDLHTTNQCRWHDWRIKYVPRKYFCVYHIPSKRACWLWDVIGFFQNSFLNAVKQWLDIVDDTITKGKASRHVFNLSELDFIIEYCKRELSLFEALMQRLWHTLNAVGIKLSRWDGAGAAAHSVLSTKKVTIAKGSDALNEKHYLQARCAYAGGRFELIRPGDYRCKVYNYDINSAYPYAMSQLPTFTGLRRCRKKHCVYEQYDLLKIRYHAVNYDYEEVPFHPYFHRTTTFQVWYPVQTVGWHWGIEYIASGGLGEVEEHFHWDDDGSRPFAWVSDYYRYRYELKSAGDKAEFAVKLVINSLYGKLAQQRGWKPGKEKPRFHQLYWAGWITAYTRSMMYQTMMQHPKAVIATETDGLFTTEPCDLVIGKGLGEWGLTVYDNLTYVQSGMYFAEKDGKEIVRYRGLDPGQLTRAMVLTAWESGQDSVEAISTRFRTLGTSLQGSRLNDWRQWIEEVKTVKLKPTGKRWAAVWDKPEWGYGIHHHTMPVSEHGKKLLVPIKRLGYKKWTNPVWDEPESQPYNVLWCDTKDKLDFWRELEIDEERFIHEA